MVPRKETREVAKGKETEERRKRERACVNRERENEEVGREGGETIKCLECVGKSFWGKGAQPLGWKVRRRGRSMPAISCS